MDLLSLGAGLALKGFKTLGGLVSGGSKKALQTVTKTLNCEPSEVLDKLTGNSENIRLLKIEERKLENERLEIEAKDRADARSTEVKRHNSSASWLSKNVAPLIAIWAVSFITIVFSLILMGKLNAKENITIMIITGVLSIATNVITYYFGSSDKGNK